MSKESSQSEVEHNNKQTMENTQKPMRRILFHFLFAILSGFLGFSSTGMFLFLAAGRWNLPFFWALSVAFGLLCMLGVIGINPSLVRERIKPGKGGQDYTTIYLVKTSFIVCLILAGLDVGRYHWTDSVPQIMQFVALLVGIAGALFALTAMRQNRFFSSVIRLQTDRGHQIVTEGLYGVVRHPGYLGIIFLSLTTPIVLGSWITLIPAGVMLLLFIRRTKLEDHFLQKNLKGYTEYVQNVRYRLFPGLW